MFPTDGNKCPALLAVVATPNYLPYAKQVLAGAHRVGKWPGDYLLIAPGISAEDRVWFESRGILVREYTPLIDEAVWRNLPCAASWHRSALDRLNLFRQEYRRWSTVVYLDCDVMVTGPLHRLASATGLRAARDMAPYLKWQFRPEARYALTARGLNPLLPAFCSGVLVFSTALIRNETFADLVRGCLGDLPVACYADQAGLNVFFARRWRGLPSAYGRSGGTFPLLVHLAGGSLGKSLPPWAKGSPYRAEWERNVAAAEAIDFRIPVPLRHRDHWRARGAEWFCLPSRTELVERLRLFFLARYHEGRTRLTDHYRNRGWYAPLRAAYRRLTTRTTY